LDAHFLNALYADLKRRASQEKKTPAKVQYDVVALKKLQLDTTHPGWDRPKVKGGGVGIAIDNRFLTFVEIMDRHGLLVSTLPRSRRGTYPRLIASPILHGHFLTWE